MEEYKPKQAVKESGIPNSTLRRYSEQFSQHLSKSASLPGRNKRYTFDDIQILIKARRLLQSGNTPAETDKLLFLEDTAPVELIVLQNIPEEFKKLADHTKKSVEELKDHQDATTAELIKRIQKLEERSLIDIILKRKK